MPRIGVDLGGTKIEGVVLAPDGRILHRERMATPAGRYAATLDAVAGLVQRLEDACGQVCTVGVGTPGALSPTSGRLRKIGIQMYSWPGLCLLPRPDGAPLRNQYLLNPRYVTP